MSDRTRNEGEGSRTAARNYYSKLRSFIRENRVEPAARDAKTFVEQHPDEAFVAEQKAKAGPRPIARRLGELATEGKVMFQRARSWIRELIEKRKNAPAR